MPDQIRCLLLQWGFPPKDDYSIHRLSPQDLESLILAIRAQCGIWHKVPQGIVEKYHSELEAKSTTEILRWVVHTRIRSFSEDRDHAERRIAYLWEWLKREKLTGFVLGAGQCSRLGDFHAGWATMVEMELKEAAQHLQENMAIRVFQLE